MMPASLLLRLRDRVPGFADEQARDQQSIAQMLWMSTQPRRQHTEYDGMFSLSKQDVRRVWGSDRRMQEVAGGVYFNALKGGNLGAGYTHGFEALPQLKEALQRCLADSGVDELIAADGKVIRTFPRVIASLSGDGKNRKTKWNGLTPATSIRVDLGSMNELRRRFESDEGRIRSGAIATNSAEEARSALHRLAARRLALDALIKLAHNSVRPGSIPIRYAEQSTGRLFAEGLSLQSAPREIRNAALAGCWDYDISNCHWALINELASRHGHVCNEIRHYLANKEKVRNEISAAVGITPAQAKECLLMIMYGAPATTYENAAIPVLIGASAAERIYALPAFVRLKQDVVKARSVIVKHLPIRRGGWVVNALGLQIQRKSAPRVLLAHVLQGWEAKALMAVVREYGEQVQLCVHDGWVTREPLDVERVVELIQKEIHFKIVVEAKFLEPLVPVEETSHVGVVDISDPPQQTQYPCGFAADFGDSRASSSPVADVLPSSTSVPAQPPKGGLVLSLKPKWAMGKAARQKPK